MAQQIIAALDLGTSKMIAFVARKEYSGRLSVLRTETFPSKDAIRRGRVFNMTGTSETISGLIRKLNNNPALQIEKMYVGVGGQSLRSQLFSVKKQVPGGNVTRQLIESIKEEANRYEPGLDENLDVCSVEYYVDGQPVSSPEGTVASLIEARFQLIVGNPCLKGNLKKALSGNEVSVAEYFISPLATAEAVLTPEEKQAGCALIEFGEGVTYISIYKNKTLQYLGTLPVGGIAITKDVVSLMSVSEKEAEALKIKHGKAIADSTDNGTVPVNEAQSRDRKIELKDLNAIIEARTDEIIQNVWHQIKASGYSQALDAGIIITGGGALLRDLPQFIRNLTGKEVRLAKAKVWKDGTETQLSPADSCVAGLAISGKENCGIEKQPVTEVPKPPIRDSSPTPPTSTPPTPQVKKPGRLGRFFEKSMNIGMNIFKDEDFDNSADTTTVENDDVNKR
jgi:cell division protein FtsA